MQRVRRSRMTDSDKAAMWERWKRGESLSEIGRAINRIPGAVFHVVRARGGVRALRDEFTQRPLGLRTGRRERHAPDERVLKKIENHAAAVALYFMYYNPGGCIRPSACPRRWKLAFRDHVWSIEEIVGPARIGGAMMKSSDLIAVSTFRSTADAQIGKGILDEAGIESMIRSDNAGGMYPAIAGADLLVRAEDVEKATEALHRRHRRSN